MKVIISGGFICRFKLVPPESLIRADSWAEVESGIIRNDARAPSPDRNVGHRPLQIAADNPLWGAPRIHGELLKLGFEVAQSTVSKYMIPRRGSPSQGWRTFLRNNAEAIAAIDLCVVPTLTFEPLFAFVVLGHGRRQLLWFAVTRYPTAEWLAQQLVEAFLAVRDKGAKWPIEFSSALHRDQAPDRKPTNSGLSAKKPGNLC
jgi:hypothetical protein